MSGNKSNVNLEYMWKIFIKITFQKYINYWICNSYYEVVFQKDYSLDYFHELILEYQFSFYKSLCIIYHTDTGLNLLLGNNPTTILPCIFKRHLLRVSVVCSVWGLYETVINNGINCSASYNRSHFILIVVGLYVLTWKHSQDIVKEM